MNGVFARRFVTALLLGSVAQVAVAQTAPPELADPPLQAGEVEPSGAPAAQSNADGGIGDIIVTAQRRSENLQNVPIAITALTSETLSKAGINDVQALQIATPSLSYAQAAGYALPRIRGVGTGANGPGVENSVALYVDGVYVSSTSVGQLAFNNIAQIAVLKGPQGTLFGRNATGGVIQITTLDPGQTPTVNASVGYGNFDTYEFNLYAATPLASNLAFDAAIYFKDQNDGYGFNRNLGTQVGQGEDLAWRGKVKWDPTESTTIRVGADFSRTDGTRFFNRVVPGALGLSGFPTGRDEWDTYNTFEPRQKITQRGISAQIEQEVGDLSLVSITAWRRAFLDTRFDADAQPAAITDVTLVQRDRQFSQELQLLSPKDGRLTWMVGAYYFRAYARFDPQRIRSRTAPYLGPPTTITTNAGYGTKSLAGFGQATYEITDATNVTAGLRYTNEERYGGISRQVVLPNGVRPPVATASDDAEFSKLTWRLAVDHRFSPGLLAYVSYNRGFKSGLYDPLAIPTNLVDPEVLDAYEFGIKADLLERRLRVNAALFHYDYNKIQIARVVNGSLLLQNGEGADIDGIDLDATFRATDRLTLSAGVSVLDHRFTAFPDAPRTTPLPTGGNAVGVGDASGNRLPMTPVWTTNLSASYALPTSVGRFEVTGNYFHNDGYFQGPENRLRQRVFDLFNANLSWTSPSGTYRASVWGKNLGDEFYAVQFNSQNTLDAILPGDRRTYGATLGVKF